MVCSKNGFRRKRGFLLSQPINIITSFYYFSPIFLILPRVSSAEQQAFERTLSELCEMNWMILILT
jgi:hypothetical protein